MAAGVITTGNLPAAHWPGVKAFFGAEYERFPVEYTALFDTETSKMAFEKMVAYTSFGYAKVKTQGAGVDYDSETQDYSVTFNHLTIGLGFIVTKEEYEDNLYDSVGKGRSRRLAYSMRATTEVFAAALYNLGFGTTNPYFTFGDGVAWFSASHPTKAGLQSNNPINADISESALEAMNVAIMTAVDGRGMPANLTGESLHIHSNNFYEAHRILKSVLQNDTANNAINVLKATNAFRKGIFVNHNFTSTGAYFIRTNAQNGPTHFMRRAMEIDRTNDFDTQNLKVMSTKRESFGVGEFRSAYASSPS